MPKKPVGKALIVVPTYNEAENIEDLLTAIEQLPSLNVEVLVVDDQSPDGTGKCVEKKMKTNPKIHLLSRSQKTGLAGAYLAGFSWGLERAFDAIIQMDADFSHHPRYLVELLKHFDQFDGVLGSRYVSGGGTQNWNWFRRLLSRGGSWYARFMLNVPISDFTGGFNGWRREALESIELNKVQSQGYCFQIELKYRARKKGFQLTEFPIVFEDRKKGQSKMTYQIILEALVQVAQLRAKI